MPLSFEEAAAQVLQEQTGDAGVARSPTATAQTSGAVDPFETAALQVRDDQLREDNLQAQLLSWRAANDKTDAGTRADVLRYSAASNLNPSYVEQNLAAVKQKVDAQGTDWNLVVHRQPSLVQFLLDQPQMTPLVKDDAANLAGLEWAMKAPYHAFLDGLNEQQTVALQFKEASGKGGAENQARIRELEAKYSNKDYGADSIFQHALIATTRMTPLILGDISARAFGGILGGAIGSALGMGTGGAAGAPAAGVGAVPGAAGGAVAGGVTAAGVGSFAASGLFNYYESVGPLYWRLSNLKDSNGNLMDPDVARAFAVSGGVVTGVLMAGFLGRLGGSIPGVKQLMQRVGAQTVEKALVQQTTQQVVKAGLARFGQHWLTGGLMMAAQSAVSAGAEEGAKQYSGQPFEVQWGNVGHAFARGFETGIRDMWLISALGPGREMYKDIGRARASAESAVRLEAMTNAANASKLAERFGPGFEQFVARMKGEKGAVETIGIPVEQWTKYWSEKKVDPGKVAAEVNGDGGKAYTEAVSTKGDVKIPVEKWLGKLARSEHGRPLLEDARMHADELTPREWAAEQTRQKAELEKQAKVRGAELKTGKQEVRDFIREQALAAGIKKSEAEANAKLVSEYAGNMALRLGVSVREAAGLGALGQLSILGPKGEQVAANARAHFQRFLRPEASQLLADRLKTLSPEARARELYLDQYVSGLRHKRAFDRTAVPEGKHVAIITSPDVKGINDHPTAGGHDVTNEMLRAMGVAIGENHPEAARGGTNFYLHVKDRAELEQVLERVRKVFGDQKLHVLGELGPDTESAFQALDKETDRRRGTLKPKEGEPPPLPLKPGEALPQRGGLHPELDVAGLKFPAGKANGDVPAELVGEIGKLSDKDFAEQVYLDHVEVDGEKVRTGLLTYEAWKAIPRKLHAASIDARGLKAANKAGKEIGLDEKVGGNQLLLRMAKALSHYGGSSFDVAHLGGDEYAAQSNDPIALERFVQAVHGIVSDYEFDLVHPETGKRAPISVDFRYGIGADYGKADRNLNERKAREGTVGARDQAQEDRSGRGEGGSAAGGSGSPVGGRAATSGRGARPQGFEEVVGYVEGTPVTYKGGRGGGGEGGGGDASFDFGNEENRAAADDYVDSLRDKEKAKYARAWLAYTSGETQERPAPIELSAMREVERTLLEHGYADPEGSTYDANGRDRSAMAQRRRSADRTKGSSDPYARRDERAGVGLSGAAAENLNRRQRGEAVFYQPPSPEESIAAMRDDLVLRDSMLERGAKEVTSAEVLAGQLEAAAKTADPMWSTIVVRGGHGGERAFEGLEELPRALALIREFGERGTLVGAYIEDNSVAAPDVDALNDSNRAQLEKLGIEDHGSEQLNANVKPQIETDEETGKPVIIEPNGGIGDEAADIPASKNLPGQAALEQATQAGLGTMLKGWVVTPEGYTGKVKYAAGAPENPRGSIQLQLDPTTGARARSASAC
jgi:hypothetical protein